MLFGASFSLVAILVLVLACFMYAFESDAQPEKLGTIPDAMWFSIVTLTTVGYGDVSPVTFAGKIVTAIIALIGWR